MKKGRMIALAAVLVGVLMVVMCVLLPTFDKSTSLRWPWVFAFGNTFGFATALSGLYCLVFNRTVSDCCSPKTSGLAFVMSACVGVGLGCLALFLECVVWLQGSHPLRVPCSLVGMVVCLFGFAYLVVKYMNSRNKKPSVKGVVSEILLSLAYAPAFFSVLVMVFCFLSEWIGEGAVHV